MYANPLFLSKEFENFTIKYCFDHITSSPCYPQSNGMIEHMVQTVKQCMKKCSAVGQDPYLAVLIYRATPLTSKIPSPAELLNGRRYRAERSLRQNAHDQLVREQMVEDKNKASAQYNKTAKDLPSLSQEEKVYIQVDPHYNRWTQGTIVKTPLASQPRSYEVKTTNGARLVRNRCFIAKAEQSTQLTANTPDVVNDYSSISERPKRVINKPKRLIETIQSIFV